MREDTLPDTSDVVAAVIVALVLDLQQRPDGKDMGLEEAQSVAALELQLAALLYFADVSAVLPVAELSHLEHAHDSTYFVSHHMSNTTILQKIQRQVLMWLKYPLPFATLTVCKVSLSWFTVPP